MPFDPTASRATIPLLAVPALHSSSGVAPMRRWLPPLLGLLLAIAAAAPDDKKEEKQDDGFRPMFDGKTLKGWVNVNCAPETFFVKDNEIITTGKPTGYLRTEKQYEN